MDGQTRVLIGQLFDPAEHPEGVPNTKLAVDQAIDIVQVFNEEVCKTSSKGGFLPPRSSYKEIEREVIDARRAVRGQNRVRDVLQE